MKKQINLEYIVKFALKTNISDKMPRNIVRLYFGTFNTLKCRGQSVHMWDCCKSACRNSAWTKVTCKLQIWEGITWSLYSYSNCYKLCACITTNGGCKFSLYNWTWLWCWSCVFLGFFFYFHLWLEFWSSDCAHAVSISEGAPLRGLCLW